MFMYFLTTTSSVTSAQTKALGSVSFRPVPFDQRRRNFRRTQGNNQEYTCSSGTPVGMRKL